MVYACIVGKAGEESSEGYMVRELCGTVSNASKEMDGSRYLASTNVPSLQLKCIIWLDQPARNVQIGKWSFEITHGLYPVIHIMQDERS